MARPLFSRRGVIAFIISAPREKGPGSLHLGLHFHWPSCVNHPVVCCSVCWVLIAYQSNIGAYSYIAMSSDFKNALY